MNQDTNLNLLKPGLSEACERNKDPILDVLRDVFAGSERVLEIGSGTGQHVVYFAEALPHLLWQPSDRGEYLAVLEMQLAEHKKTNLEPLVELDVRMNPWPVRGFDAIFSANSLHFMSTDCVVDFFRGAAETLFSSGLLAVYGPFRYQNEFTSESNAHFDVWLKQTDPVRGVRDFEWINSLAVSRGLQLISDTKMPANNQLLVWSKD
ncbi:MAG: DUF938 domain-containing protein [Pseudomonadota bacterium]|nr:DUF938 domain-containing protein [Pseudomonadota bacterium]